MYAPDGTEAKLGKMSRSAGQLYLFYCRWRDHSTGYSRKGFDRAVAELELALSTAYRAQKELLDKDMILETSDGRIGLRGGSFAPYDKTKAARCVWATPRAELRGARFLNFENEPESVLKNESEILIPEKDFLKNENSHNKERARGSSINLSISSPSHTHTPQPPHAREADAGVCVSELKFEDYRDFARSTPTFTKPDAWAMRHFPLRDADLLVSEWKERRALVLEGRPPVEQKQTPFHVAAQAVHSVSQVEGSNVAGFIAQMRDVSEETREKLIERFVRRAAPEPLGQEGAA
jgi:hypothetical protein